MESYRQLVQGQADLALVNSHIVEPSVVSVPLFSERVVLLCSKGLYPEGAIHPSQLDRSLSISTGWSPDFQAWFEYWFGKTLSASYLRIKIGSMVEYFGNLQDFWIVIPESSAEHIQKNTGADVHLLADAPPDRICYALYMHHKESSARDDMLSAIRESLQAMPKIKIL